MTLEEHQRVQQSAGDRFYVEEVRGDDPLSLGGEELVPTIRRTRACIEVG